MGSAINQRGWSSGLVENGPEKVSVVVGSWRRASGVVVLLASEGMVMSVMDAQIDRLEARLRQLKARKHRVESRSRALESRRARKDDTRRKILVGAVVLAKVEQGVVVEAELRGWLDAGLTRGDDRALFGL